ncbi:MAG: hypothetical protein NC548_29455 [Lachnospiraceae bacterium]|nr:hypothetical protein [Lachnospiraceae bacterium]
MRKLTAIISALAFFLFSAMPVQAANPLVLTPPYFTSTWTGNSWEFTIPYSASYKLTLSGAQGGHYGNVEGGRGITLTKTIWLKEGTVIKGTAGTTPGTYTQSGSIVSVYGGGNSELYIDGQKTVAGGGQGTSAGIAITNNVDYVRVYAGNNTGYNQSSSVHWHGGNKNPLASFPTKYQYGNPGGCYVGSGHTHGILNCSAHELYKTQTAHSGSSIPCPICGHSMNLWHQTPEEGGWEQEGDTTASCDGGPCDGEQTNTWNIGCGQSHGQINGLASASAAACTNPLGMSASQDKTGNGSFTIELVEQNRLSVANPSAPNVQYIAYSDPSHAYKRWNVIVMEHSSGEHYVAYCKHGNL